MKEQQKKEYAKKWYMENKAKRKAYIEANRATINEAQKLRSRIAAAKKKEANDSRKKLLVEQYLLDNQHIEWRMICDGRYMVSEFGDVINLKTNYILKKTLSPIGYQSTSFMGKAILVHRIVAMAFLEPVKGKNEINHKDGIKTNNHHSNLEWSTRSENVKHSFEVLGRKSNFIGNTKFKKAKYSNDLKEQAFQMYDSGIKTRKISEDLGFNLSYLNFIVYKRNNENKNI